MWLSIHFRPLALGFLSAMLLSGAASAAEVRVMISGGLTAAYRALVPEFERATGHKVLTAYGPSMGTTTNAIPVRLERGEPADVARGDAEIGFQQVSELKPVEGIDIVGPLPDELQKITVFSAGIASVSKQPDAGKALITFLASPAARAEIVKSGMDPIPVSATN